jgi:plasmid stabilization system protein ParE
MRATAVLEQKRREQLIRFNGNDTLANLRATLYYFENIADATRAEDHQRAAKKLKSIISNIEAALQASEEVSREIASKVDTLFDVPEMQQHAYDLRAVLGHDGLVGRAHSYAYTKDPSGTWWKIVDYTASQVSEEIVLSDRTGLHHGAGPYILFYSRVDTQDAGISLNWPKIPRDIVKHGNAEFRAALPEELLPQLIFEPPSPPPPPEVHLMDDEPSTSPVEEDIEDAHMQGTSQILT